MAKLHLGDSLIFRVAILILIDSGAIIIAIDKIAWPFTLCQLSLNHYLSDCWHDLIQSINNR